MSYSIDIYEVVKTIEGPGVVNYTAELVDFSPWSSPVPDEYIRSIKIDDLSIDPVDFFAIVGRKCRVELSIYGEKGWFTELNHSRESHPDFSEWFPFIFVVRKESNPIFIGGLKKQNYTLDELNGTETLYLSDALDIFIDITRKEDITEHITEWYLNMIPSMFQDVLRKWTSMLNYVEIDFTDIRYYLNDISIVYPDFNVSDFEEMWNEHGDFPDAERLVTCWVTSTGEIKIVFWIKYMDNYIWFAQGYQCWLDPVSPFNILRKAQYIGGNREGYHAGSEPELLNLLVLNGVLPSAEAQNVPYIEYLDTIVSVNGTDIYVSGYFYPNPQRFNDNARQSEILRCMLLVNMCTVSCTPKLDASGNPYDKILISNRINPNTNIAPYSDQALRYFTADKMTHIKKRAILIDDNMFDATSSLIDAENKRIVLRQIYAKMLKNIVYTITFNVPSYLEGVSSLQLGDIIQTSGTMGNWIITGISDEDENGLLTFTCAGGY